MAGSGSLSAALPAAGAGDDITLFDRFGPPHPVGSGLVIRPVCLAVLDLLGAGDAARAPSCPIRRTYGDPAQGGRSVPNVHDPTAAPLRPFNQLWRGLTTAGLPIVTAALLVDTLGAGSRLSPLTARHLPRGAIRGTAY